MLFCRFLEKASKSILSDAKCFAMRHRRNGLAMFLNQRALFLFEC